jgi:hypothetical protein
LTIEDSTSAIEKKMSKTLLLEVEELTAIFVSSRKTAGDGRQSSILKTCRKAL